MLIKNIAMFLLSTVCLTQLAQNTESDRTIQTKTNRGEYVVHAPEQGDMIPVTGESYYSYQWALKNDGTLRRISTSGRGTGSEENYGPGVGRVYGEQNRGRPWPFR